MNLSISEKLISQHLLEGQMEPGEEIALRIDHTLIQDSTGTLADLQLEAHVVGEVMGVVLRVVADVRGVGPLHFTGVWA